MPQKPKSKVSFRIKRSEKSKQFRCVVVAANGEPIFTGEPCKNRKDVTKMVERFIDAILHLDYAVVDEACTAKLDTGYISRNWP